MPQKLFFTVDLEDFRYLRCRELGISPRSGSYYVESGIEQIKNILSNFSANSKITFFTTAQVARDQKDLVRSLVSEGHEIACHSFEHENLATLNYSQLRDNVRSATSILEDVCGEKITGFRAPSFRIPNNQEMFFNTLAELGYTYDSSLLISPSTESKVPYFNIPTKGSEIIEFPIYKYNSVPGLPIRVIGGTYFRLLPLSIIKNLLSYVEQKGFIPILWLHPVDLCQDFAPFRFQEALKFSALEGIKWPFEKLSLQTGTMTIVSKLEKLLKEWQMLGTMGEYATFIRESCTSRDQIAVNS